MTRLTRFRVYLAVTVGRWWGALVMVWRHRRTLSFLLSHGRLKQLRRFIFVSFFIRGEDCGKGVLDPLWKLTGRAPFLWDIEAEVTTRCYLRCIHCEHTYFPQSYQNRDLTLEQLTKIVDDAPNLKWINLTGEGSAFLNPEFIAMVQMCKDRGLYVDFAHDFYRITTAEMRDLIDARVERVFWSVDATTPATYAKIRVNANLGDVVDNVREFLKLKGRAHSPLPEVCVRFTFFSENIHELPGIIPFLEGVWPDRRDWGDEPSVNIVALLDFEQTKHMVAEVPPEVIAKVNTDAKRAGWAVYWSHVTHDEAQKPPADWCMFWSEPYVMINGHVMPCCSVMMSNQREFLEANAFGNVRDRPLRSIWNSQRYQEFRRQLTDRKSPIPILCQGCRTFNTKDRITRYGVSPWV